LCYLKEVSSTDDVPKWVKSPKMHKLNFATQTSEGKVPPVVKFRPPLSLRYFKILQVSNFWLSSSLVSWQKANDTRHSSSKVNFFFHLNICRNVASDLGFYVVLWRMRAIARANLEQMVRKCSPYFFVLIIVVTSTKKIITTTPSTVFVTVT